MEFIETPSYTKVITALISDEQHRALQNQLLERPEIGKPVPGAMGMRKMRAALRSHGKSGGFRIWYFHFRAKNSILLVFAMPKNKGSDLTKDMERRLAAAAKKEF
jgi:hypothetical protein